MWTGIQKCVTRNKFNYVAVTGHRSHYDSSTDFLGWRHKFGNSAINPIYTVTKAAELFVRVHSAVPHTGVQSVSRRHKQNNINKEHDCNVSFSTR